MTDHNKLAQRIVALGVGQYVNKKRAGYWYPPGALDGNGESAERFCTDGRVVLALLQKLGEQSSDAMLDGSGFMLRTLINPIAIVEACLEALEDK